MGSGQTALIRLSEAYPDAIALLAASGVFDPQPVLGGTLVPGFPTPLLFYFATDGDGRIDLPINGGGGPFDLYIQYLIQDPGAAQGVSFSNAIKAIFQ